MRGLFNLRPSAVARILYLLFINILYSLNFLLFFLHYGGTDDVLGAGEHIIKSNMVILSGAKLTIAAGATLRFYPFASLYLFNFLIIIYKYLFYYLFI